MESLALHVLTLLYVSLVIVWSCAAQDDFMQCMSNKMNHVSETPPFDIILSSSLSHRYMEVLLSSQQNPRWVNTMASKPLYIITPSNELHIQASVICSRIYGLQVRVRSGGHDYEGLSYTCDSPFVLIDLANFRSIEINIEEETAWVQSGATIGELYYEIAKISKIRGFPAGICPSVGVGGHFSSGGIGTMVRKHALAADHVVDAYMIDASGKILDRKLMGEDLFWAIRGGGAASFGVVLSWKVKLVKVPATVSVFTVSKPLNAPSSIRLARRWQDRCDELPDDLFIRVIIQKVGNQSEIKFNSLFLGEAGDLIREMDRGFPELGLRAEDCAEMSWIESVLYFAGYKSGDVREVLLDRVTQYKSSFKAKSDFVKKPIPEIGFKRIREMIEEEQLAFVIMDPLGGKMSKISEFEIPFPHRKGNLYNIQYLVKWDQTEMEPEKHLAWIKRLFAILTPYVSKSPRAAYANYRDLDLGVNNGANTSYLEASVWGKRYFKDNFERLVEVKTAVDPENFFRGKQSIPTGLMKINTSKTTTDLSKNTSDVKISMHTGQE